MHPKTSPHFLTPDSYITPAEALDYIDGDEEDLLTTPMTTPKAETTEKGENSSSVVKSRVTSSVSWSFGKTQQQQQQHITQLQQQQLQQRRRRPRVTVVRKVRKGNKHRGRGKEKGRRSATNKYWHDKGILSNKLQKKGFSPELSLFRYRATQKCSAFSVDPVFCTTDTSNTHP